MRIRFLVRQMDFGKNDTAAVRAVRKIQYNNLLFYLLFIIICNILYNIYNSLFIRLAVITHNCIAISHPVTVIFIITTVLPQNVISRSAAVRLCCWHLLLQRGVTGTARMLHALTHSSISRQVSEQM